MSQMFVSTKETEMQIERNILTNCFIMNDIKLKEQTLAAQSTNIQGASGASYTTYGWRKSLQGAMVKAGL